jgi:SagB-type dehydrogenase family enzyme
MVATRLRSSRRWPPWVRWGVATLPVMTLVLAGDSPGIAHEPQIWKQMGRAEFVTLPPVTTGAASLDDALKRRRSVRTFSPRAVSQEHLGQLCWAAQGITDSAVGFRTAPSAGALYPLELYLVLPTGLFHYEPRAHRLKRLDEADRRAKLARAAIGQDAVRVAGVDIVVTAVVARTRAKYGSRAERYVQLEAGHAAQNVLLEATAIGLGALPVGAFDDDAVRAAIGISGDETPLYILAVGHPGG